MLLIAGTTAFALPASPVRTAALLSEIAFVLLAAVHRLLPRNSRWQRISSPAYTFLTMNVAALSAIAVFLVQPQKLWRPTRVNTGHAFRYMS